MSVDPQWLQELHALPLLQNCGKPCTATLPYGARQVASWQAAIAAYTEEWSTLKDDRFHDISLLISQLDRERFNSTWSETVIAAKAGVAAALQDKGVLLELSHKVVKFIEADLLCALIEHSYALPHPDFPAFYLNLYTVYRAGHFPCGWAEGEYPYGNLLYF